MRKSKQIVLAAAAATVSLVRSPAGAATSYTWADLAGGTQSWTDSSQWTPSGSPLGAASAGDSANLNVGLTSNLMINVPTGNYYVDNLKLGGTGAAVTTDVGNSNADGGTLILDGGTPNFGAYADIYSLGSAGSTNIISAPIQLDQNDASTQTLNSRSGTDGNYLYNTTGVLNSLPPIGPIQTALPASVIIDPSSTNNLTLNGPISQAAGVTAAICNLMTGGQTLTINGGITITNASSTVAQAFVLTGPSGSTTIVNGVVSDGAVGDSVLALGNSSPSKTTVYPAISPTIELNGINTYTGITTMNMSTVIVGSNQAFGVLTATATVGSSEGELRMGGTSNEFGYNLESANDSITINNGIDVSEFLTIEGQHSLTVNGYMYETVNRELINLLPAGKSLTINGQIYCGTTTQNRIWIFDGPGLTVVNGSLHNSSTEDSGSGATGSLTKSGTGITLMDGTAGTYIGPTIVNGGLLEFAAPGSYGVQTGNTGTSSVTVNAGGAVALDSNAGGTAGTTDSSFLSLVSSSSTGALALTTLDSAANLNFTTGTLANLANMSVGAGNAGDTYTGTITPGNSTYRLGGGGTLTIPNTGGNALTGAGNSLVVTNGGAVVLGGSNNYGGTTTIQGVYVASDQTRAANNDYSAPQGAFESTTLSINSLANGGSASGIGSSSNVAGNLTISGGTLQYTGTGGSTDRLFTMTPVGATLDSSGTGAVDFTNTGAIAQTEQAPMTNDTITASSTGVPFNFVAIPSGANTNMLAIGMTVTSAQGAFPAGSTIIGVSPTGVYINNNVTTTVIGDTLTFGNQNRTLTLTGTNTGQNILSATLGNSATGQLSVVKNGAGTWVLTGNNTYAGGTIVNAGTLDVSNASGSATGTGNVTMNGGVLSSDSGSISGNVIAGTGSHTIAPGGIGSIGTLSVGGLTSSSLTTLNFDLGTGSGVVTNGDLLVLGSGTVSIANGTHLSFGGSPVGGDDYRLIGGSIGGITLGNLSLPAATGGETYALSTSVDTGYIDLVVTGGGPVSLTWNDASADNLWNTTSSNWNSGSSTTTYSDGAGVTFNDNNGGNYSVTLNSTVAPASVLVNNSSGNYSISGTGSITGTTALTKSGSGNLTLSTANSYTGGTTVNQGTLVVGVHGALPAGAVAISNGAVQLGVSTGAATVTSLAITGNGTFDVNNDHLFINYGSGTDPITSIAALLKTGYNGGHWNGAGGIVSSAAAVTPGYGLGYADSADTGNPASLASGNIEIKYTLLGDTNLDGVVNAVDFGILAANFNKGVSRWDQGDFNYDNVVSAIDFGELAANFNKGATGTSIGLPAYDDPAILSFAQANGLLADVPEPASIGLLAVGTLGLMARRRKTR